jgi:ArsR family transcriptional regulator
MDSSQPSESLLFARALSDETRQELMRLCCCEWRSVGDLAKAVGVTQPTVSHHLAFLKEAGLVDARHVGRQTFYTLNQDRVAECCGRLVARYAPEVAIEAIVLRGQPGEVEDSTQSFPMHSEALRESTRKGNKDEFRREDS